VILSTHWSNIGDKSCQTKVVVGHFIAHMKNLYDNYPGQIMIAFEHFIIHMENHTIYNHHMFTIASNNYSTKLCFPLGRAQFAWIISCNIHVNSIKSTYATKVTLTTCCFNQLNQKIQDNLI